jgi:hypothetical protein
MYSYPVTCPEILRNLYDEYVVEVCTRGEIPVKQLNVKTIK